MAALPATGRDASKLLYFHLRHTSLLPQIGLLLGLAATGAIAQTPVPFLPPPPAPGPPFPTSQDLEQGKRLFLSNCAPCHGPNGDGGKGSDLTRPRLPRAADDSAFFTVIRRGIPGTEMPNTRHLLDLDIWQVIAYVRMLELGAPALAGDARRGAEVYRAKGGCAQCHMIAGQGGRLGPELTDIGARRSPGYLRKALTDPEQAIPENFFIYRFFTVVPDNFLQVRVVTKDGRRITGVRLNEDPFSIQIRDYSDHIYSFWKSELSELHEDWGKSPMPSYRGKLTPAEIDDLVAYLVSLKGTE